MNRRALFVATAIAALSFSGQAFARGGDMGGAMSMGATPHQMSGMSQSAAGAGAMAHGAAQGSMAANGAGGSTAGQHMKGANTGSTSGGSGSMGAHQSGMSTTTAGSAGN